MSTIIMFPGQGSQFIGMGKELHDNFLEAKEVFQEVDDVLNQNLSGLIFSDDIEQLTLTQNAQPAIMAASIATLKVLQKQSGKSIEHLCDFICGHSLGEYSAYTAAKALNLRDTAWLLYERGKAMAEAASEVESGMAALIGGTIEQVEHLIQAASDYGKCEIAIDNGAGQIVISGTKSALDWAIEHASRFSIKRAIMLNVSGAFHSSLMKSAALKMLPILDKIEFSKPVIDLITNVEVKVASSADEIRKSLIEQITSRVRWREIMELSNNKGITKFIEVGPGKVLTTIAKRMNENATCYSVNNINDIEELLKVF